MFFKQKSHPLNFDYPARVTRTKTALELKSAASRATITCAEITPFCTRLTFDNDAVTEKRNTSDAIHEPHRRGKKRAPGEGNTFSTTAAEIAFEGAGFRAKLASGATIATSAEGIGFCGAKSIITFDTSDATAFYGFGERTRRLNKAGESMEFYTIDVAGVFPPSVAVDDKYDPTYVSIPLAIVRAGGGCVGLFFDNPQRLVIDAGNIDSRRMSYMAMAGNTDLYLIDGPTLRDVTRNFAELTGRAEMPPVWAMGYHQCRWSYENESAFRNLAANFQREEIPVSALWYDIDYMDGYRVFTWDKGDFPDARKLNTDLKKADIHVVTIVDPGVKLDPGYAVYDSGKKNDVFCKAASGRDFVGRVWPGDTVFPDYTVESAREWWAEHLARFMKSSAVDGAWLDMNDPSTGWSNPDDMLFENGRAGHDAYHNQYGHFMARASRRAFEILDPQARPFLLTRSGATGTQRHSAIWTGDNASTWEHLRMSIPMTINLGLSGVAFNGPDVGGFLRSASSDLLVRWYQAGFLFPFFRNHTAYNTKTQEPWEFGPKNIPPIREAVQTRYRLLPHLYNCFFHHWLTGDPILRPLIYEFDSAELENVGDQFLVGDSLMLAPIVEPASTGNVVVTGGVQRQLRHIVLPAGWWFDLLRGEWVDGGRGLQYGVARDETPIFVREGAIIPWFAGPLRNARMDLTKIELHIFAREQSARLTHYIDDRASRRYLEGAYNTADIAATFSGDRVEIAVRETGGLEPGGVVFTPVVYGRPEVASAVMSGDGRGKKRKLQPGTRRWVGRDVPVLA